MALEKNMMMVDGLVSANYWKLVQVNRFEGNPKSGMVCIQLFLSSDHAAMDNAMPMDSISISYSGDDNPFTDEARANDNDDTIAYNYIKSKIGTEEEPGLAFKLSGALDI